jgi:hypothetical protein
MDPYLEDPAYWRDFHGRFIYAVNEYLLDHLPPTYDASVDEEVRLIEIPPRHRAFPMRKDVLPDVAVLDGTRTPAAGAPRPTAAAGGTATLEPLSLEPVTIEVPFEQEVRERWIEVRYRPDNSLVTIIEVLSPSNKAGEGLTEYRDKRRAIVRQDVNLVEIDLLVGGRRLDQSDELPPGDYYVLVSRTGRAGLREVYAWPVRRPLPPIRVPLRPSDDDVRLDMAASFNTAYDRGRYVRRLQYAGPPPAPLSAADAAWATEVAGSVR